MIVLIAFILSGFTISSFRGKPSKTGGKRGVECPAVRLITCGKERSEVRRR